MNKEDSMHLRKSYDPMTPAEWCVMATVGLAAAGLLGLNLWTMA